MTKKEILDMLTNLEVESFELNQQIQVWISNVEESDENPLDDTDIQKIGFYSNTSLYISRSLLKIAKATIKNMFEEVME